MPQLADSFDLGRLGLASGEGRSLDLDVRVEPVAVGGQGYRQRGDRVSARLDCSRTTTGWSLRLRLAAELRGSCMRCLEDAVAGLEVDTREVEQPGADEELHTPYLDVDVLDLRAWTRDAIVLALPAQVLCGAECRGLCPTCGANLNRVDPAEHDHREGGDPRWARLREMGFK